MMRRLPLSLGPGLLLAAAVGSAQEPSCNPCVDPPRDRVLVPDTPPLLTAADIPREPIPSVTPAELRRLAPEEAVRRLILVLEARGETGMAEQLRSLPPEDAIRDLLASWGVPSEQSDAGNGAGQDETAPRAGDGEPSDR